MEVWAFTAVMIAFVGAVQIASARTRRLERSRVRVECRTVRPVARMIESSSDSAVEVYYSGMRFGARAGSPSATETPTSERDA